MVATPYTQPTLTAGMLVGNAEVQAIVDGINWLQGTPQSGKKRRPYFFLQQTVAQTMGTSGTDYPILFDSEIADTENAHSTSTNTSRYTTTTSGVMLCFGVVGYLNNTTGTRRASFQVNGTNYWWNQFVPAAVGTSASYVQTAGIIVVSAGDYIELVGRQVSGGSLNTSTALNGSLFAGVMLTG